ncbi:hypothetical protein NIE79_004722 [Micromonospora sp. NIE79]|uniref:Uncharacterized protein n=1 Tax=Micromonospora trifolii TaxID=2911208 RepID=A0ABS9N902_9ACTN|nr:hypothetical protein [Micromonospora trifolii]MCG5446155.1 hypothetical protein [Micromonospora trifolii]
MPIVGLLIGWDSFILLLGSNRHGLRSSCEQRLRIDTPVKQPHAEPLNVLALAQQRASDVRADLLEDAHPTASERLEPPTAAVAVYERVRNTCTVQRI